MGGQQRLPVDLYRSWEGENEMSEKARKYAAVILEPLAGVLHRLGVTPNMVTVSGFVLTIGVAALAALGLFFWAALLMAVAAGADAVDGTLARTSGQVSKFGAFLDSTLDRSSESIIYMALALYYLREGSTWEVLLAFVAIVASLLVSYTRARAEGVDVECKVGIGTRMERMVVLFLGLLTGYVTYAVVIVSVIATVTVLQRVFHVWKVTASDDAITQSKAG